MRIPKPEVKWSTVAGVGHPCTFKRVATSGDKEFALCILSGMVSRIRSGQSQNKERLSSP